MQTEIAGKILAAIEGIQRYSGFNKSELAEKIVNHILSPSVMKKRMCTLSDEQIAEFEGVIKCGNKYIEVKAH